MSNPVPVGWSARLFSDAVTLVYGKSPKDILENDGAYPVIGTGGITGVTNSFLHEGKTTVIGRKGTINKPSYIETKFWAIDTTYYVTNYKSTDPKWFFYLLQDIDLTKYNEASGVPSLNRDTLYAIPYISPPLPEQQIIAKILTAVDEVIEKTQAQIDKLKDLKTGMMQELLTQGVGVDGKPHTEFKDSPVGRIPKAWSVVAISSLCSHIVDCVNKTAPVVDSVTPYKMLRTSNIRHGRVDTKNVRYVTEDTYKNWTRRLTPAIGDLIFTREAPVGECGVLEDADGVFLGQRTMMYRADLHKTTPHFLMYSLMSEYGKKQLEDFSGGSTVPHMRVPDCEKILIKVPPKTEQDLIVDAIRSVDRSIYVKQLKAHKLADKKKALMQDLLTGKVRVTID
ncbi:restriction endonuclease subunit S [Shewanella mangrovisoli]|uniref:restriction endonuclease subunit S n=1 Tax=Shewanella mangrovisoli TaxID=2864211 RepID=UPI0035B8AAD2